MPPDQGARPDAETLELLSHQVGRYQALISRLAGNSVQVKTWSVTLAAAVAALAVNNAKPALLLVAVVVLSAFGTLDAYYLSLERHFRAAAARAPQSVEDDWRGLFHIEAPPARGRTMRWLQAISSGSILGFYGPLLVIGVVASRVLS